jgi:hypothetical protein
LWIASRAIPRLGAPIVVDDTSVYLVAFGGHGIVKIAK